MANETTSGRQPWLDETTRRVLSGIGTALLMAPFLTAAFTLMFPGWWQ